MKKYSVVAFMVFVCALLGAPARLLGQTVTLGGSLAVASAEDFASRTFQDPWDMNERTDFGGWLNGTDLPVPDLNNISFSGGVFSATTGPAPNVFLLETGNPFAAKLGKTGTNYPINADDYRLFAIRMYISAPTQSVLNWNVNNLWDGTNTSSNVINMTPGWRTYLVDLPTLGIRGGTIRWSGLIRSLQFYPAFQAPFDIAIDWVRLVTLNASLCRQVTWSGFSGAVNLYLDPDTTTNGNETLLYSASNVPMPGETSSASHGCSAAPGGGYNFYAGGLAPGSYQVLARPAGSTGVFTRSAGQYVVNATPTLTIISPSDEGSTDDFATTILGNAWDMNALSDVDQFFGVTGQQIATIPAETPAGVSLGNVQVLWGASVPTSGPAGDPIVQLYSTRAAATRIDPNRYRILTMELGVPNAARNVNNGSIARIAWRVAGGTDSVSDDIIFNSRLGVNVMDKITLDMADRAVLPIEEGSQAGWVPGNSSAPGIDRLRLDPHEFPGAVAFYIKRVKLAALERLASGSAYTFRWTASEANGTVYLYYDTDRNPASGLVPIGAPATSAGSFTWNVPVVPTGEYYIYALINDGQGNGNGTYARWPVIMGSIAGGPNSPTMPPGVWIVR